MPEPGRISFQYIAQIIQAKLHATVEYVWDNVRLILAVWTLNTLEKAPVFIRLRSY